MFIEVRYQELLEHTYYVRVSDELPESEARCAAHGLVHDLVNADEIELTASDYVHGSTDISTDRILDRVNLNECRPGDVLFCDGSRFDIDTSTVITIRDGVVHLECSFNPDSSFCGENEVQMERYSSSGWNEPRSSERLASDFWDVWTDWNGRVSGGIELYDHCTYDVAYAELASHPVKKPSDIKSLPDGTYTIVI